MNLLKKGLVMLVAEDDKDDRLLIQEAIDEAAIPSELHFVGSGVELLSYLRGTGDYADRSRHPLPRLILLDLNMPKMDGREALAVLKADKDLRRIPVIVLTTSKLEDDIAKSYELGAASYMTKPATFDALVELMRMLGSYWTKFAELPKS